MAACPRCRTTALADGNGGVGESACPSCHGCFLPPDSTERVVVDELGLDREMLREIAGLFSGLRVPCPGCTSLMRPLRLRGVAADLCFSCGGLWLDVGELERLTGGRHVAPAPSPAPSASSPPGPSPAASTSTPRPAEIVGRERSGAVKLGRGPFAVVFDALEGVPVVALQRAFSHTDALTDIDAQLLFRNNSGVVVEGVARDGADGLAALLATEGVGASVVDGELFRLPPVISSSDVDVTDTGIEARLHTGPPLHLPWSSVGAVVAGVVRRERLESVGVLGPSAVPRSSAASRGRYIEVGSHEVVTSEEAVVEILQLTPIPRRLRVTASPLAARADVQRRLCDVAARHTAVGRGPRLTDWPRYRRIRELERELSWVAWRAARWPVR